MDKIQHVTYHANDMVCPKAQPHHINFLGFRLEHTKNRPAHEPALSARDLIHLMKRKSETGRTGKEKAGVCGEGWGEGCGTYSMSLVKHASSWETSAFWLPRGMMPMGRSACAPLSNTVATYCISIGAAGCE